MEKLKGEIILIDDEEYEEEFLNTSLGELKYDVSIKYFNSAKAALHYLKYSEEEIFLIICDFHMPEMNGVEMKKEIDADPELKRKAIPFVFDSAVAIPEEVELAYKTGIQGYFKKPHSLQEMKEMLSVIIRYWIINIHPNKTDFVA
jgi:response regulator RpfG family c-di-GMP phosphodiesterase